MPKKLKKKQPNLPEGRFYEAELPEPGEIVMVKVKRIVDMGVYVQLLEYNGLEGMITLSQLTARVTKSYHKLLRVGRTEVSMVIKVDADKGYLDLSKRKVTPEDAAAKEEAFSKAKAVHSIIRHVAGQHSVELEDLCMKTTWPLHKKHGDAYEAFRRHVNGEINVWDELDFSRPGRDLSAIADKLKADIELHLRRRLEQSVLRLRAKVEVACPEYDGIDAVQEALLHGLRASKEGCEVKIHLIACPLFIVWCTCRDKEFGIELLKEAADLVKESIEAKGGSFFLRSGPEIAGRDEEHEYPSESSDPGSGSDFEDRGAFDETMGILSMKQEAELELAKGDRTLHDDIEDDDQGAAEEKAAFKDTLDKPS